MNAIETHNAKHNPNIPQNDPKEPTSYKLEFSFKLLQMAVTVIGKCCDPLVVKGVSLAVKLRRDDGYRIDWND